MKGFLSDKRCVCGMFGYCMDFFEHVKLDYLKPKSSQLYGKGRKRVLN